MFNLGDKSKLDIEKLEKLGDKFFLLVLYEQLRGSLNRLNTIKNQMFYSDNLKI